MIGLYQKEIGNVEIEFGGVGERSWGTKLCEEMSVGIKGPEDAGSHVCQELAPYTLYVLKTSDISLCGHGGLIPSSCPLSKLLACLSTRGRQGKGERKGIFKVYLVLCRRLWPKTGYGTS